MFYASPIPQMYFYVTPSMPQMPLYTSVPGVTGCMGHPMVVGMTQPSFQIDAVKGSWTAHEDELLKAAVQRLGTSHWDAIAAVVKGRTATQCRERWLFRLTPGLKKAPFEKWEDDVILEQRQKVGNHWTLIASGLPGRTSCSVKNRWYTVLRKKQAYREQRSMSEQTSPEGHPIDSESSAMMISALLSKKSPEEQSTPSIPMLYCRKKP
jgi:hypothetical protein